MYERCVFRCKVYLQDGGFYKQTVQPVQFDRNKLCPLIQVRLQGRIVRDVTWHK